MVAAIFGLIGVVVGAMLTLAKEWWFHRQKTLKEREYLAIVVSCALDTYAHHCADVVGDDGLYHGQTDEHGYHHVQTDTPKFEPEKLNVEWKSLPAELLHEILGFPAQANYAQNKVDGAFDYCATPPEFVEGFEERMFQYAKLGLAAAKLAEQLRKLAGLHAGTTRNLNSIEYMKEELAAIEANRAERECLHALHLPRPPVNNALKTT